jgi:signal transduction histidine kinase/CHASE3 domain sensor protein
MLDSSKMKKQPTGSRLFFRPEAILSITVIFAFVLVAGAAISSYMHSSKAIQAGQSVEKSQELLGSLESIVSIMNDMKTQAATYIRTGDKGAVTRYNKDKAGLAKFISFVKHTGDEEGWRRWHFTYIEQLTERFINILDISIKEKDRGNVKASEPGLSKAQQLMEVIRGRLIISDVDERAVLKERLEDYKKNAETSSLMFISLGGFILLFVIPLALIVQRYIGATQKAFIVEQQVSREIVQHAPIGIIQMEADFKIKDINPVFRSYLAEEENIDGLSLWQLLPELPRDELTNTVASGKPAILKDVGISQIGSRTDLERYWDLAAWPMMEGDKVRSLILLIEDMSDKTILSRQKEVLQQTIAHDLKSPLIASNYLIQAMMKKHAKNGDQELLMRLQDSNEDALKMVKNMLEVSKYRQGVHVMAHSEVVLNDLVNNIVSGFDFRCQVSEVSIALILPNERIQIQSDEAALKHLVGNLLENAIKFSPRQTAVTITLKQQDDQVSIDVHNSGPGIHEKDKEKLFTPFWQGELGQQSAGGTGIGLYLSQQIAHALGGTISFTSDELSGTTFTITLPSKPKVTNGAQK